MKTTILALIVALCQVDASHFLVGNFDGVMLMKREKVEYSAIPFFIRSKQWFYSSDSADKNIMGIRCWDLLRTHAKVSITAGGVGFSYVNLQFESERGKGIDYDVAIYVKPE